MFCYVESGYVGLAFYFALVEVWNEPVEASAQGGFSAAAWAGYECEFAFFYFYGDVCD
jgi:hypothetical protein